MLARLGNRSCNVQRDVPAGREALEANAYQPGRPAGAAGVAILAIVTAWCVYWFVRAWPYWEDDAYIHLEFARSVAAGRGFSFNGRVVAGDTAPLWVLLLAGMHALIPDWLIAGKVLTALGAIFGLSGTYAFARRLAAPLRDAAVFPAAAVLLVAVNPYACYWLFSGMEPFAAMGVAFFAILAATRPKPAFATFLTGCFLAGVAPLLRPEMVFLAALLAAPLFGQWLRLRSSPAKLAVFAAGLVLLVAPLALWSLYSLHAFGHLLPNTNAAKRAAPADSVPLHLLSIYAFGLPLIVCGLLAGIACLVLRPATVRDSLRSAVASIGGPVGPQPLPLAGWLFVVWPSIATVFYVANHSYVQTRYILLTAPGLTIIILALALQASRRSARILYGAALLVALGCSILMVRPFIRNKGSNCEANHKLARFIRDHIPPDAPIAAYAIGQIAFESEHPIVDTGGITRPGAIAQLLGPPGAIVRWAQSEGAQYYIMAEPPEPGAVSVYTSDQMFVGWSINIGKYATSTPVSLWKLPPRPGSPHAG
jgi:hypothetical protein